MAQEDNSALRPGSRTKRAHSEDAKFRITYEARQKIRNLCGEGPLVGEVSRGLLVFPGKHCRLSNVDSKGCYISTERFTLGDTVVEHLKGQRCRALDWAVALREQHPSELSEVDIMLQPASNMDGVLLARTVAQQGSEEPASLHIRDSFAALFHDSVAATQRVVNQGSSAILGKMTQALQVTDTDFAQSFKASFRRALEQRRTQWRSSGATGLYKARFEPQPTLPLINYLSTQAAPAPYQVTFKDIVLSVVSAQRFEQQRNLSTNFVVGGAIRNGLLVYRPRDGKLTKLCEEDASMSLLAI